MIFPVLFQFSSSIYRIGWYWKGANVEKVYFLVFSMCKNEFKFKLWPVRKQYFGIHSYTLTQREKDSLKHNSSFTYGWKFWNKLASTLIGKTATIFNNFAVFLYNYIMNFHFTRVKTIGYTFSIYVLKTLLATDKRTDVWSRPSCIYTQIPLKF